MQTSDQILQMAMQQMNRFPALRSSFPKHQRQFYMDGSWDMGQRVG